MNVYAVWSGSYSDKGVVAVFSTHEKAQAYIDECAQPCEDEDGGFANRLDEPWIESYALDAEVPPSASHARYQVNMDAAGNVREVTAKHWSGGPIRRSGDAGAHWIVGRGDALMLTVVWATDEAHAVKVANERRVMSIARGELEAAARGNRR